MRAGIPESRAAQHNGWKFRLIDDTVADVEIRRLGEIRHEGHPAVETVLEFVVNKDAFEGLKPIERKRISDN